MARIMPVYTRLLTFIRPYWPKLVIAMVFMVWVGVLKGGQAWLVKPGLDRMFIEKDLVMLWLLPLAVVGLFLVKGALDYQQTYLMGYVGQNIICDLRNNIYRHLQSLSLSFFSRNPTGVLISRITNDVTVVQGAVSNAATGLLRDSFTVLTLAGVVVYRDWKLALISFILFPLAVIPIVKFGRRLRRLSAANQAVMASLTSFLGETIAGQRVVKVFAREEYEKERFHQQNRGLLRIALKTCRVRALSSPVMEVLGSFAMAGILYYGGLAVIQGVKTPGDFFSFLAAMLMLYQPVKRLNKVNNVIQAGLAAAERVFLILDSKPDIEDAPDALDIKPMSRSLEFSNVTFCYQAGVVLKDVSFKIQAGQKVALVGLSGGGKSTLASLIPRFYDVTEGAILIDRVDIRRCKLASLRSQISMVTQQVILFDDTVRANIGYGDLERSTEEIIEAAKAAYAHDFITNLPQGYDTAIGEGGLRLSGGERQRLAIARALLKDAPLLILDEATSSLDMESESEVQKALENLMKGRTSLVIAHRLSTVRNADRILVLAKGRIVEDGTHDSLMALNNEYRRLYQMQFAEEEREIGR
jgi:subfamily B ATP-binding cassette protein MsbA